MPKASPIQTSFNAGELSPRLEGRPDFEKYRNGCRILENFIPQVHGGVTKRPGTRFVKEVKSSSDQTTLIPFEVSTTQAYIIEFGELYARFYTNNGALLEANQSITNVTAANPAVITITAHGYSNGEEVYLTNTGVAALDNKFFLISNSTANTFEVSANGTGWTSGGNAARTYEITTTYTASQAQTLQYTQSADVLYLAAPDNVPRKLSRVSSSEFLFETISFDWPAFLPENIDESITLYASGVTGTVAIFASSAIFTTEMITKHIKFREIPGAEHDAWAASTVYAANDTVISNGNVYETALGGTSGNRPPSHDSGTEGDGGITDWEYLHSGEGYARIVGYGGSTNVTATVIRRLPESVVGVFEATFRWSWGAWSPDNGYPKSVAFYEQRLLWAGTAANPQTIWGSVSGDYQNYKTGINADDAYQYTIASDQVNAIEWMSPGKALAIGTAGGEFIMTASSLDEAITPTNVKVSRIETKGSKANIKACRIGNKVLFVQRSGRKLRELEYVFDNDDYQAQDLTLLSEHITGTGISKVAYQQEPDELVWFAKVDGELICMTYAKTENVFGWHRHPIAGTNTSVESIAVIPNPNGLSGQFWMSTKRTINGSTKRYIEYLEEDWKTSNDVEDAFFIDSGLTYDGSSVTTISGLDHLEGETVTILADGATHPTKVVSGGSVTLDRSASVVQAGLGYNSTMQTMRFEAGAADGTAQGKTKRITNATFRLYQTGPGLWYGPDTVTMDEIQFRDSTMAMDEAVPLFDGDKGPYVWPGGYEKDGRVTLQHRLPLPCNILAVMPQLVTQDR